MLRPRFLEVETMAFFSKDPAPPAPANVRRDTPVPATGTTFVGANITLEGTISGSEPVIVEGTIRGNVKLSNDLRVGTKGRVEATVHARNLIIEGRVEGDVSADERVELVAGSSVDGNIKAPKIVVAEGAKFRGNVDMGSARPREDAEAKTR
jgi:cytoskeletal protein CcmA (bactofilin family)